MTSSFPVSDVESMIDDRGSVLEHVDSGIQSIVNATALSLRIRRFDVKILSVIGAGPGIAIIVPSIPTTSTVPSGSTPETSALLKLSPLDIQHSHVAPTRTSVAVSVQKLSLGTALSGYAVNAVE
jgi:hypothetical protein